MAEFDIFDTLEAQWLFFVHWHNGTGIPPFFAELGFKPRPNLEADNLSENGREIYNAFVAFCALPEIGEPIEYALEDCIYRGHDMILTDNGKRTDWGLWVTFKCMKEGCDSWVTIIETPQPNQTEISGPAVAVECPHTHYNMFMETTEEGSDDDE